MDGRPRVSIVTPCGEAVRGLADTLDSVVEQADVDVEHVVVGRATDAMSAARARYPRVKTLASDPARGRAAAVNLGLGAASGVVLGVLDAGDRLAPGALAAASAEIDPARARHVVIGRCLLGDESGRYAGLERPSEFAGLRRLLEIWRGASIAPPAIFWSAEAWRTCGPMDESAASEWIDYDFACRLARAFEIRRIDRPLAIARLRPEVPGERWTRDAALERGIAISRRHWGSPLGATSWRLRWSLARHRADRVGRARRHARDAHLARREGTGGALRHALAAIALSPAVAFYVGAYPALRARGLAAWRRSLDRVGQWGRLSSASVTYLDQTDAWSDGWVGPRLAVIREVRRPARSLGVSGWTDLQHFTQPLVLTVRVDGRVVGRHRVQQGGDFLARLPLAPPAEPGPHTVDVEASTWFVPDNHSGSGDLRPLAWRLGRIELDGAAV